MVEAEASGEEGGAAGGSGTLPQARAGGAARTTHEGPVVRRRPAVQILRARAVPVLKHGDPGDPLRQPFATSQVFCDATNLRERLRVCFLPVPLLCWNVDRNDFYLVINNPSRLT